MWTALGQTKNDKRYDVQAKVDSSIADELPAQLRDQFGSDQSNQTRYGRPNSFGVGVKSADFSEPAGWVVQHPRNAVQTASLSTPGGVDMKHSLVHHVSRVTWNAGSAIDLKEMWQ